MLIYLLHGLFNRYLIIKIVAAFRGMHVSPAKHSFASVTDGQTDRRTDGQTTDKVIPMCRYASQATQKTVFILIRWLFKQGTSYLDMCHIKVYALFS